MRNSGAIFVPQRQKPVFIDEISFSVEDQMRNVHGILQPGEAIQLLKTPIGKMAILNCHDYTHADVLAQLIHYGIEILIVSTFNPASRLYHQYALADMHGFFCFVIISNIANYGGSAVFAPFRRIGPSSGALTLGGTLSLMRGESVAYVQISLPLGELRRIRRILSRSCSIERKKGKLTWLPPIFPGETFFSKSEPSYKTVLQRTDSVKPIKLDDFYNPSFTNGKVRIGIAHLKSMDKKDYIDNFYHISASRHVPQFIKGIRGHLQRLENQLLIDGKSLDFLVFPEVFLPLGLEDDLKQFAKKFNTIVIGGIEYDRQSVSPRTPEEAHGSNRCFVYIPTNLGEVYVYVYTKLTRSQYDARTPAREKGGELGQFNMDKGNCLLRFSHNSLGQFGVLICYDFSHFDIVHKINRHNTEWPPELLIVVAYNPDSSLYESCCIADSHRFYQYIVMCNVAQYGGSGVFGPIKTPGARQTVLNTGVGAEGISIVFVDLCGLQKARKIKDWSIGQYFQKKPGIFQNTI